MLTPNFLTVVAVTTFSIRLINATPTPASLSPALSPPVLYSWSTDPLCTTTAKQSDCATASKALCARPDLTISDNTTVGDCTAFYRYDAGNLVPTAAACTAAYAKILAASIGGAWGYNANQTRTDFPLYAVYPNDGNGNCFKAAGDASPVLAMDALPGGGTLPTCPVSSSRRRRAPEALRGRDQAGGNGDDGVVECMIEDGVWGLSCTAVCLATVTAATWITGPFLAAGWLACLGTCSGTGATVFNNCEKAKGNTERFHFFGGASGGGDRKRRDVTPSVETCHQMDQWTFECKAQGTGLLDQYGCGPTINT